MVGLRRHPAFLQSVHVFQNFLLLLGNLEYS